MATANPFDLLIDDDAGDPADFIAALKLKLAADAATIAAEEKAAAAGDPAALLALQTASSDFTSIVGTITGAEARLRSKPVQPVREAKNEGGRGDRGNGRVYGRGRGGGGFTPKIDNSVPSDTMQDTMRKPYEGRNGFDAVRDHGGRRGGFSNGDADGERPKRNYERRSGTGRDGGIKRDGAGRGNWGTATDDIAAVVEEPIAENEVNAADEKPAGEAENVDAEKENIVNKPEEEPEEKQMTLGEYEKVLEEKRKELLSLSEQKKGEERKVDVKEFQSMQLVSKKKNDDEVFIKLGSEKDNRREAAEKEEKAKKSVSINEFLKPAEGEAYYRSGGRGRGRGRGGDRGGRHGGGGYARNNVSAPKIEDQSQFRTLGGK